MDDVVLFGNTSREVWRPVSRPQDNAKSRSYTKRGPGRMPFRRALGSAAGRDGA